MSFNRTGEDDEAKLRKPWRDDELDAIVADYFAMLEDDLSGRSYANARHSEALMARIDRTVKFKPDALLARCCKRVGGKNYAEIFWLLR